MTSNSCLTSWLNQNWIESRLYCTDIIHYHYILFEQRNPRPRANIFILQTRFFSRNSFSSRHYSNIFFNKYFHSFLFPLYIWYFFREFDWYPSGGAPSLPTSLQYIPRLGRSSCCTRWGGSLTFRCADLYIMPRVRCADL